MDLSRDLVLKLVRSIPTGKVATYGQIAAMAGFPRNARQVGDMLRGIKERESDVPWQRVINAAGGISTYKVGAGELQKRLLEAEGIRFNPNGTVNLSIYRWQPDEEGEQLGLFG